jgi:putative CocE/NonD family hydrolase
MGGLLLWLIAACLLLPACWTYRPIEEFPTDSAPQADRTGKRSVSALGDRALPATSPAEERARAGEDRSVRAEETVAPARITFIRNPSADRSYQTAVDVAVPARDGAGLKTDFYFPAQEGRFPVILERTPFDRRAERFSGIRGPAFARGGFIYAVQNVRGTFDSEGYFYPFRSEAEDGRAVEDWIAAQPWSAGILGALGTGYGAYAALLAAPRSPTLKAMVLENCTSNPFLDGGFYLNGIPMMAGLYAEVLWRYSSSPDVIENLRWDDALFHLPLSDMDDILGEPLPFWDDCLANPSYNHFWESFSVHERLSEIDAAVLHVGSWHSLQDLGGTIANYRAFQAIDEDRGRSGRHGLFMGPWSSGMNTGERMGFLDFTSISRIDEPALLLGWFSRWLDPEGTEKSPPPAPVRIFMPGANEWIDLPGWPPPGVTYRSYFLRSSGQAALGWDHGLLSLIPPSGFEEIDFFISDPANPVMSELEKGADDQRQVEQRVDVLTYTTPPLRKDLDVAGAPQMVLYVNTSAPDTDLFVMLTDVDGFGYSRPVSMGAMRTRFRDSFRSPSPLPPEEVVEYVIDMTPAANRFLKGHSMRVSVMGSYFPVLTRNLNTGSAIGQETEMRQASIFLLHDFEYASRLVLPVLPEGAP